MAPSRNSRSATCQVKGLLATLETAALDEVFSVPTRFGELKSRRKRTEKCRTARSRVWRWRVSHTCQHRTPVQRHGADDHVHVPVVARPDAQRDCIRRPLGHACHYSCPSPSLLLGRRSTRSGDCSRGHFHRCKRSQTNLMSFPSPSTHSDMRDGAMSSSFARRSSPPPTASSCARAPVPSLSR